MPALQQLEARVRRHLEDLGLTPAPGEDPPFALRCGSTLVVVSLFEEAGDTYCRFTSVLLRDFEPSIDLLTRLLRLNTEVLFGAFLLFEDDTLSFSTTLLGDAVDLDTFDKTLDYVARISDDFDDELQALGGGLRAQDLLP